MCLSFFSRVSPEGFSANRLGRDRHRSRCHDYGGGHNGATRRASSNELLTYMNIRLLIFAILRYIELY